MKSTGAAHTLDFYYLVTYLRGLKRAPVYDSLYRSVISRHGEWKMLMRQTFYALNGLRAVAATMVAIAHLLMRLLNYDIIEFKWQKFTVLGSCGVYTFFVISGFILIKSSGDLFGNSSAFGPFFTRRLIRVLPLYYVFTLAFVLKSSAGGSMPSVMDLILSLSFIPYVNNDGLMQPIYSLGWTLDYEMYFYLVFASCLCFRLWIGVSAIFAVIISIVVFGQLYGSVAPNGDPQDLVGFLGSPVSLFFLAGISIGLLHTKIYFSPSLCFWSAVLMLSIGVFSTAPSILACACIVAVFLTSFEHVTPYRSLSNKTLLLLGESAYSIYLTHSFVLGPLVALGLRIHVFSGFVGWIYSVIIILVCLIVGLLTYIFLERPLIKYLREKIFNPANVQLERS